MFSKLTDIKGVGNRVKERLISHFGSEENALSSLKNLEFEKLTLVHGIPKQKMVEILRNVYSKKQGFEYADLLKTGESRVIYRKIINLLDRYFSTEYGRLMLSLYYPTKDIKEIKRRLEYISRGKDLVGSIKDLMPLKEELKWLGPLEEGKISQIKDSAIVTEGREIFNRLNDQGIEAILLESMQDLEYIGEYPFIRYIQSDDDKFSVHLESLPSYVEILQDEEEKYLPERSLAFFSKNKDKILAASRLLGMLDDRSLDIIGISKGERDIINEVANKVRFLEGTGINGETDEPLLKFSNAYENLDRVISECLETANYKIVEMIEGGAASIKGRDVLGILENLGSGTSGNFYEHLPPEITSLLMKMADEGEERCAKRLKIDDTLMFSGLFADDLSYPLKVSETKSKELESWLRRESLKAEFKVQQDFAAFLSRHKDDIGGILTKMLEIDILVSLGEFSRELKPPVICDSLGLGFRAAKNIFLTQDKGIDIQPVDYVIGESDIGLCSPKNQSEPNHKPSRLLASKGERIVIITGANSGGKTTLIETIAQLQIMAQMGLPVMAEESYIPIIDELYFFGKNSGDTGAGAFESLLKSFATISLSKRKKLILADEIEAVTEPGAAAKIISGIVTWFLEDKNTLLAVVTHLGKDLEEMEGTRIDGIEATGLDEDLNLIADRNPKLNTLAKSTPELIMEKLSKKEHRDFYTYILEKFRA